MVSAYLRLSVTWMRAAMQYPFTLVMLTFGAFFGMSLDLAAIGVIFTRVPELGGFTPMEVLYLWGTSQFAFGLSDALFGATDRLANHIKAGSLDTMLVRPVSPLVQVATEAFTPRKFARLVPSGAALSWALARLDLSAAGLLITFLMVVTGTVIFCAIWVLTSALQFVLINGHEAAKALTWGGGFMTQYPMSVYGRDFVLGMTFVIPLAFVNWQPSLYVLGHDDPLGLPPFLRFASPVVAVALCAVAALAWRTGLRHYRSTGS